MQKRTVILVSVLVAVVALIGGLLGIAQRSTDYEASARVLIVPSTEDDGLSISGADTLSRGPVASTFSEAFSSSEVVDAALQSAGIDGADVAVTTTVITDTSALLVTATSSSPVLAERAADAVARAEPDLGGYSVAFRTQQIGTADGTASRTGPASSTLVLIAIIVALGLGIATAAVLGRIGDRMPSALTLDRGRASRRNGSDPVDSGIVSSGAERGSDRRGMGPTKPSVHRNP